MTARREQLLLRSAALRQRFAHEARALEPPLARADRVLGGLRWLRGHPGLVAGGVVVVIVLRPRQAWRWALRGWWGWRLWQRLCSPAHRLPRTSSLDSMLFPRGPPA